MAKEKKEKTQKEKAPKQKIAMDTHADKLKRRKIRMRWLRVGLFTTTSFLVIIYFLLNLYYTSGDFTIIMDPKLSRDKGIIMYEDPATKINRMILTAPRPDTVDNISINWLPSNIDNEANGSHNGDNYLAYTFYVENLGLPTHYWYSIHIDDVIQEVDEAARIMLFLNGERTVYAKKAKSGNPEPGTVPFYSTELILIEKRENMQPGDIDKFTIVIWVEGDDPECLDPLIGGMMKMHMEIQEESIAPPKE